ncbi:MAG: ribonuclease P protein component [Bacteroidales bacterium]|nr:ribonuclease P protein component [Bacteroidales bacterium]
MTIFSNSLIKNERLCLTKQIDRLFSDGRWLRGSHLKCIYLKVDDEQDSPVRVLFSVPKKIHRKAVARNLLKRRMRESYRVQKHLLYDILRANNILLNVAFVYTSDEKILFGALDREIKQLLAQLASRMKH